MSFYQEKCWIEWIRLGVKFLKTSCLLDHQNLFFFCEIVMILGKTTVSCQNLARNSIHWWFIANRKLRRTTAGNDEFCGSHFSSLVSLWAILPIFGAQTIIITIIIAEKTRVVTRVKAVLCVTRREKGCAAAHAQSHLAGPARRY